MSKVNTLSNTQVCKCFHYNTGFFLIHLTEHACCLRAEWGLLLPQCPPSFPVPSLLRVMTTQKYFTLGAGFAFCGSVNSGLSSNAMSFRNGSPHTLTLLTLFLLSANRKVKLSWKHRGVSVCFPHKMHLLFFTIPPSQRGPPKPTLRSDVFTPLFRRFDDYNLTISGGRSIQIIQYVQAKQQ